MIADASLNDFFKTLSFFDKSFSFSKDIASVSSFTSILSISPFSLWVSLIFDFFSKSFTSFFNFISSEIFFLISSLNLLLFSFNSFTLFVRESLLFLFSFIFLILFLILFEKSPFFLNHDSFSLLILFSSLL